MIAHPTVWVATLLLCASALASGSHNERIDRHALVSRHNFVLTSFDGEHPVQVGNGEFAFGMDITGLQTFAPFNTMSHWGWHSSPLPPGEKVENLPTSTTVPTQPAPLWRSGNRLWKRPLISWPPTLS